MHSSRLSALVTAQWRDLHTPEGRRLFVRKYWHAVFFLGYLVLTGLFGLLETFVVPRHWISCTLDQAIPFLPVFVIPYVLWFPLIAFVLIALFFHDRGDFIRTIMLLYAGMAVALVIYVLFPHGQPLRPIITETDFFSRAVRNVIYANDTNTNCCPSIHVLNQMAIHIGLCKSKLFGNRRGWKAASLVATILVCSSTCFIKQHSIIDVTIALLLEVVLYLLVFKIDWSRHFAFAHRAVVQEAEEPEEVSLSTRDY